MDNLRLRIHNLLLYTAAHQNGAYGGIIPNLSHENEIFFAYIFR